MLPLEYAQMALGSFAGSLREVYPLPCVSRTSCH
jgi:hypothetical protein